MTSRATKREEGTPTMARDDLFDAESGAGARPRHVAIIMDGNGRWATRRGLPRLEGHRRGVDALRAVVEACPDLGVETLTLFAFSTENWRRPEAEVSGLMGLVRRYLRREAAELAENGVRVRFIGDRAALAPDIRAMMTGLEERTAANGALTLVIALNYGGRAEIAAAARRLAKRVDARIVLIRTACPAIADCRQGLWRTLQRCALHVVFDAAHAAHFFAAAGATGAAVNEMRQR